MTNFVFCILIFSVILVFCSSVYFSCMFTFRSLSSLNTSHYFQYESALHSFFCFALFFLLYLIN